MIMFHTNAIVPAASFTTEAVAIANRHTAEKGATHKGWVETDKALRHEAAQEKKAARVRKAVEAAYHQNGGFDVSVIAEAINLLA